MPGTGITLKIDPSHAMLHTLKDAAEENVISVSMVFATPLFDVEIGPFGADQFEEYLGYLSDPEGAAARAEARSRIVAPGS